MKATESDGDHLSRTEKVLVYREIGSKERSTGPLGRLSEVIWVPFKQLVTLQQVGLKTMSLRNTF